MIVVLTPNPAVDVTYRVAEQRIGETQRVLDVARRPGGKGVNVARVLAADGVAVRAVLPLGGTAGRWLADALATPAHTPAPGDGTIAVLPVPIAGETRTTVTVVDDRHHPTMLGEPGPTVSRAEWDAVGATLATALDGADDRADTDDRADALVVSGSFPGGTDPERVGAWIRAAHRAGVLAVADVAGPALLAAAAAGADVCKPNRDELLDATGTTTERDAAAVLLDLGAGLVVVSRGADGIAAWLPDPAGRPDAAGRGGAAGRPDAAGRADTIVVPAVPGVTGNPTGAGDAATAGLVRALVRGASVHDALRHAAAFGAAAVLRPTAGEIDRDAAARFLADLAVLDPSGSPA